MKIVNIIGTRPQYIKLGAMCRAFKKTDHEILNIDTGQHYDEYMSDTFIKSFKIPIHHKTMHIPVIREILNGFKPDIVLLYGDTYSTLIGLLASKGYKTAHIEAGARTHSIEYREELIRMTVDHMCDYCFVPSKVAFGNLIAEGVSPKKIFNVGDVMYDVLLDISSTLTEVPEKKDVYMTLHRPLNVDNKERLQAILNDVSKLDCRVIFPAHPRTVKNIREFNISIPDNIQLVEPVSYTINLWYIKNSKCVITDSGGVEKECYLLKTPGVIIRNHTPWPEIIWEKWNRLVQPNEICDAVNCAEPGSKWYPHYGIGNAANRIIELLEVMI